jgi:hypothetical protein
MDGSSVVFIVLPIVSIICLATWLGGIYWADSHPRWGGSRVTTFTHEPDAIAGRVPGQRQAPAPSTAKTLQGR